MITMVVPTRNRAHSLRLVAPSYYAQEKVTEIIFVIDAGADCTEAVIAEIARQHPLITTKIITNLNRLGASQSRNVGVQKVSNEFVLFCDDDEYLEMGYAQTCLRILLDRGAAAVSGRRVYMLDGETPEAALHRFGDGFRRGKPFRFTLCEYVNGAIFRGEIDVPFTNAIILTHLRLLLDFPFDPYYARGNGYREETDYQMNLFCRGYRILVTNNTHSIHLSAAQIRTGGQRTSHWSRVFWSVWYTGYFHRKYYASYAARVALRTPLWLALGMYFIFAIYREFLRPIAHRTALSILQRRHARAARLPSTNNHSPEPRYNRCDLIDEPVSPIRAGRTATRSAQADVIILSWNRPDDTIAAIASAVSQEGVDSRVLILDQGSDPPNIERLEAFVQRLPGVALKKLEHNSGVAGGRNLATAMGSAQYVIALDSDAIFADRHMLARAVTHLDANPGVCAIGFRIRNYFTGEDDETSWDYPGQHSAEEAFLTTRFVGAGHAIRRSIFEAVGGYDDRLFFCLEEVDLCYRMINLGYRIEYCPTVTVLHKISPKHRINWDTGRYFYTVRNALYSSYKFGTPTSQLLASAFAFLARGIYNRVPGAAARGLGAAVSMCFSYSRSAENKSYYRLTESCWQYILSCEPLRNEGIFTKIRRQFTKLPGKV
jgi:GT2 family glycosyltransferase